MEPGDYGEIRSSSYIELNGVTIHRFIVINGNRTYEIDRTLDKSQNKVTILGTIDLTWTDTKISSEVGGSFLFKREIKKSTIYFMDGEIALRKQQLNAKPFRRLSVDNKIKNNFLTMDIETITRNNKLIPYLICAYNGNEYITSYGNDQKVLFNSFIDRLLSTIKSSAIIYAHNL